MDEIDEDRLNKAWDAILNQYFNFCMESSKNYGPGMNMFYIKNRIDEDGKNCNYFYCEKNDEYWNSVMDLFDDNELLNRVYNPDDHIILCVQLQHIEESYDYGCTIRLFDHSKNEVNIYSPRTVSTTNETNILRKRF